MGHARLAPRRRPRRSAPRGGLLGGVYRGFSSRATWIGLGRSATTRSLTPSPSPPRTPPRCLFVSTAELALGEPTAAVAICAEGNRLLLSDGGPDDWRACALHITTASTANNVGDRDSARPNRTTPWPPPDGSADRHCWCSPLAIQGHVLCDDKPHEAVAAIDEAIGLFEAGAANTLYYLSLIDTTVLAPRRPVTASAQAHTPRIAVDEFARAGNRASLDDSFAATTILFAAQPERLEVAATVDSARHGDVFGQIPLTWSAIHQTRIDAALELVATTLDTDAYAKARQHGAR